MYLIEPVDYRDRGRCPAGEETGAVTSLLLIVDAHAMTVERQENVSPRSKSRPIAHFLATGTRGPLCVGNLPLAVLKKNVL